MSGLIGFAGSVLGGIFTRWGVNKTLKIQDKEKFRDECPLKIKNLDSINEELIRFLENEGEKYNVLYDVLYKARQETRPKIDNSSFYTYRELSGEIR
jgi:Na+/glutamate symporter